MIISQQNVDFNHFMSFLYLYIKTNTISKGILYGIKKCVYPIVDSNHFVFSFAVLQDAISIALNDVHLEDNFL